MTEAGMTQAGTSEAYGANAIAIVGMAGRFPGSASLTEYWRNLEAGREGIETLTAEDLTAHGVSDKTLDNPAYVRRAPLLTDIEEFDAEFFGFTPRAARMMDPQHRLFLQTAYHALEDAGLDPHDIEATVGVFGTSSASGYLLHNLMSHLDPHRIIGEGASFEMINLSLENDKDHLATRVAHQFNLRGPALAVQTACSSSLLAVHLAAASILNGECEMALAGGSSIRVPNRVGYWYEPGSMASPSGYCRPFDSRADGTLFGSGVGIVVLKHLDDALAQGDRIHAVIRGSAINNDGATKMNYAAPTAAGQAEVIAEAHAVAEVDAATISYVETHGTATPLGDPIEVEGLRQAFELAEQERRGPCVLGSVKANIGHLETASGIAGLIKTVLCLQNRSLPGTLHYTQPNPELHLERTPFEVRAQTTVWESDGPRRAGVSSFGVGGTNVHVVLEEAPPAPLPPATRGPVIVTLSAQQPDSLTQARTALADDLQARPDLDVGVLAHTLNRRHRYRHRLVAVVDDATHAVEVLRTDEHDNVMITDEVAGADTATDRVAFLFPGQGAQHVGMARGLLDSEPVFAEHFAQCVAAFDAELGIDLRAEIFEGSARSLERTDRTQPALFAVEYALARLAQSRGVHPAVLAGHSIGEYVAGTLAGVFDLPTAASAVAMRARLMNAAPRGVMVAVPAVPAVVTPYLAGEVDIATINDPGGCVVAGTDTAIAAFTARLAQAGITARRVRTSHAFHSRLMDGVVAEYTAFLSRMTLREPQIPLLSNVTGTVMSAAEATNPATWARQIRATVRFADEVGALLENPARVLVEVGPGGTLSGAAARHPRWGDGHRAIRLMRHPAQNRDDRTTFLLGLGQLWSAGVPVDLDDDRDRPIVTLPGYPFARQRHWVDHDRSARMLRTDDPDTAGDAAGGTAPPQMQPSVADGRTPMETTLGRIWAQCLGVESVERTANFFEIGGDSLIAISIAMSAANEGLEITPQDLYENQTVATLAATLTQRYAAGGLGRTVTADPDHLPLTPTMIRFLDSGVTDSNRWRVPLILRVRDDVGTDRIRDVLTAVVNRHDALRIRIVEEDGIREVRVAAPVEAADLAVAAVSGAQEIPEFLRTLTGDGGLTPYLAAHVQAGDGQSYLAMSVHGLVADEEARDILVTDLFTAFGQVLAGEDISLAPVPVAWRQWAQLSSELAAHPAVLDSRRYWLTGPGRATRRPITGDAMRTTSTALQRISTALTTTQTIELDDARRRLTFPVDRFLLTALGRALAQTFGDGIIDVDLAGRGRRVLRPDLDPRRTLGSFTALYPVALGCTALSGEPTAAQIEAVHRVLAAVPHHGVGHGVLRHLHAPTARALEATPAPDIALVVGSPIPDLPTADDQPVSIDPTMAEALRASAPGFGHALEIRAQRSGGILHVDWWYDPARIGADVVSRLADASIASLADLAREAIVEDEADSADGELELIDLTADVDLGESGALH